VLANVRLPRRTFIQANEQIMNKPIKVAQVETLKNQNLINDHSSTESLVTDESMQDL
jgi:hypothetical protein